MKHNEVNRRYEDEVMKIKIIVIFQKFLNTNIIIMYINLLSTK